MVRSKATWGAVSPKISLGTHDDHHESWMRFYEYLLPSLEFDDTLILDTVKNNIQIHVIHRLTHPYKASTIYL